MGAEYQAFTKSANATFNSPSMSENEFGVVCQMSGNQASHGVPTWDGTPMTLAVERMRENASGSTSIYYIVSPSAGVSDIVRGAGVSYCFALRISNGATTQFGDTAQVSGTSPSQSLGITGVVAPDIVISCCTISAEGTSIGPTGDMTEVQASVESGGREYGAGYAENNVGAVNEAWDYAGTESGNATMVGFFGRQIFSSQVSALL